MKGIKMMELPRNVVVGPGVIHEILPVCSGLKLYGNCIIITGNRTEKIAGKIVKEELEKEYSIDMVRVKESNEREVERVVELSKKIDAGFIVSAGGGKIIDVGKLSARKLGIPVVSVPTSASHDGIASSRASIKGVDGRTSVEAVSPVAVIADTEIISSAPFRLIASGCGDILANKTAVMDWKLAYRLRDEEYSEYAAALSEMTAEIIMESGEVIREGLEEGVRLVVKALISSGVAMSIAGSSRPASGSEHLFSHALDMIAEKPALHGEQCGVGTIMMMSLHGGDWERIRKVLKSIGAPVTAVELGVDDDEIIEALLMAHKIRPDRYTILGSGLTRRAAKKLAKKTGVI